MAVLVALNAKTGRTRFRFPAVLQISPLNPAANHLLPLAVILFRMKDKNITVSDRCQHYEGYKTFRPQMLLRQLLRILIDITRHEGGRGKGLIKCEPIYVSRLRQLCCHPKPPPLPNLQLVTTT